MRLKTGGISDIEINTRFRREVYMIASRSTKDFMMPFFPIRDIVTGQRILLMFKSYTAVGVFGPTEGLYLLDQVSSDLFMKDHNEYMIQNIMEYKHKGPEQDPNGFADYANYYLVDDLIVFKPSVEEYKANNFEVN